jgi:hypothetical protein
VIRLLAVSRIVVVRGAPLKLAQAQCLRLRWFLPLNCVNPHRRDPQVTAQRTGPEPFGFAQGRLWATGPLKA